MKNLISIITILRYLTLSLPTWAGHSEDCERYLKVVSGKVHSPYLSMELGFPPIGIYENIGSGVDADIYRVEYFDRETGMPSGEFRLFKIYRKSINDITDFYQVAPSGKINQVPMIRDVEALAFLEAHEHEFFEPDFRIVKGKKLISHTIFELENIEGQNLEDFWRELKIPEHFKQKITKIYTDALEKLVENLENSQDFNLVAWSLYTKPSSNYLEDKRTSWLPKNLKEAQAVYMFTVTIDDGETTRTIRIKPSDIIVEKRTGSLVLVDPY